MSRRSLRSAVVLAAGILLLGCASSPATSADDSPTRDSPTEVTALPVPGVADYQLGGGYTPDSGVTIVARDSTEDAPDGVYGICYLNGFQTQPQESANWLAEHPELLLHRDGVPLVDPGWPDEYLLDTSTAARRSAIADILAPQISGCAARGYEAVEFDNLDTFTRSGGLLTESDNLDLAHRLVALSHDTGLATGQKNSGDLGGRGRDLAGFDFAIVEECHRYDECAVYTAVYGEQVIDVEYTDDLRGSVAEVCADPAQPPITVLRDRALAPRGADGYRFEHC